MTGDTGAFQAFSGALERWTGTDVTISVWDGSRSPARWWENDPVIQSAGFKRIAEACDDYYVLVDIFYFLLDLRKGVGESKDLRAYQLTEDAGQRDLAAAVRLLTRYAQIADEIRVDAGMPTVTQPAVLYRVIDELKNLFEPLTDLRPFIGKKAGFNEYVIRRLHSLVPTKTPDRYAAISELMRLSGFKVTRQLVATTIKEADRRTAKG